MTIAQNISLMINKSMKDYMPGFLSEHNKSSVLVEIFLDLEFLFRHKSDEQIADFMRDQWPALISAIQAILNPGNGEVFSNQKLKLHAELLIGNIEAEASPKKNKNRNRSVSFGESTIHQMLATEDEDTPKSPPKEAWQLETADLLKRVMAKHEHKADPEVTRFIKKPVAAVISTLAKAEKIFDKDDLKIEQIQHTVLPVFIAKLLALIYPTDGTMFPDHKLKEQTDRVIDKFESLTPPQGRMFFSKRSQAHTRNDPVSGIIPTSQQALEAAMKKYDDEPCCWNPLRLIFG